MADTPSKPPTLKQLQAALDAAEVAASEMKVRHVKEVDALTRRHREEYKPFAEGRAAAKLALDNAEALAAWGRLPEDLRVVMRRDPFRDPGPLTKRKIMQGHDNGGRWGGRTYELTPLGENIMRLLREGVIS